MSIPNHLTCPFCPSQAYFVNTVFKEETPEYYRFLCPSKHVFYLLARPEEETYADSNGSERNEG